MTEPGPSWEQIWQVFHHVAETSEEQRTAVLERLCQGDERLRQEVESLLGASEHEAALFSAFEGDPTLSLVAPGQRIGSWQIVRAIGQGGMGAVYEGRRFDDDVDQRVAIKLLLPELGDRFEQHFLRERRILARLEHPHIARFLDAGREAGKPYLVMEFIEGRALHAYCAEEQLDLEGRLGLMCAICDAVGFAHRNLIVHRDIKPSNILVTDDGSPKLLDFGIARLLEDDHAPTATRLMTPNYASPEQLQGEQVTTASDVYSLGVVLYELLTDRSPYRASSDSPFELLREVIEGTPNRPSKEPPSGASSTSGRSSRAVRRTKDLRGDLDTIALTALHKDPGRRYSGAEQFASDLRAYLGGFPISARADSASYRARKFLLRHPVAAASAAVTLLVLSTATILLSLQARRLEGALESARTEQATSESVSRFLLELLDQPDPMRARGRSFTVEELIDNAALAALEGLERQPAVRVRLLDTLSTVELNTGDLAGAEKLASEAVAVSRTMEQPQLTGTLLYGLGLIEFELGKRDRALTSVEESLALLRGLDTPPDLAVAKSLNLRGVVLRSAGEYASAVEAHEAAIELLAVGSAPPEEVGESWNYLGVASASAGRLGEAEGAYRQALSVLSPSVGRKHPTTISVVNNLGSVTRQRGGFEAARELFEESIEVSREVFGDDHPTTIVAIYHLGRTLHGLGQYDQGAEILTAAVEGAETAWGDQHPSYAIMLSRLGSLFTDAGRLAEAEAALEEAHRVRVAVLAEGHPALADDDLAAARLRAALGRAHEATKLFEGAIAGYRAALGEHPKLAIALLRYAEFLLSEERPEPSARADSLLEEAEAILSRDPSAHRYSLALVHSAQAEGFLRQGQEREARRLLESSLAVLSGETPDRKRAEERIRRLERGGP